MGPAVTPRRRIRLLGCRGVVIGFVALGLVGAACGDDGRSTEAVHRLIVETCQGRLDQRATGVAIGDDLVATVAHSLEEARNVELRGSDGASRSAEIVYLDRGRDIALLGTEGTALEYLTLMRPEGPGPVGVLRLDEDDQPIIDRGQILELTDVTLDGEGRRAAVRLQATIEPGDSGAAVLDDNGDMVAMVFASARGGDVGWAVSATEIDEARHRLGRRDPGAEPPDC